MNIHCIILWHYYSKDGILKNSSATDFIGTSRQLVSLIKEAYKQTLIDQKEALEYSLVQQILYIK